MRERLLPGSLAHAFHDGHASLVVEAPPLCEEYADEITDELCRFLEPLNADQLLVTFAGVYTVDEEGDAPPLCTLRALVGERGRRWRHLIYPLPFDDVDPCIEPVEVDPPDPFSARIRTLFDGPRMPYSGIATILDIDDRYVVGVHPKGPLANATMLHSLN